MIRISPILSSTTVAAICVLAAPFAAAQNDRLYDQSGKSTAGAVIQSSAKGVQIRQGNTPQAFTANEIEKILYEGDPAELTRGREFALEGQYEQALEELSKIDVSTIKRELIEADVAFYKALSQAELALAGQGAKDAAVKAMLSFAGDYRDSWHFYDAAKVLGDLALALGNPTEATKYYKSLSTSPALDTKIQSVYLQAMVMVRQGDNEQAINEFDKVIKLKPQTPQTVRTQVLARAGKAIALAQSGQAEQALELADELIADLDRTDVEAAARIYNAQGAGYEASGDFEGAVLAYLHTHLMFSSTPDAHAEALGKLVQLWPKVGKPERAAEARQELQQRYPGAL